MLYSVRMRAAQGGAHEAGGRHISGAERITGGEDIAKTAAAMLERALTHSRGQADFINIQVEAVAAQQVHYVPLLPIHTFAVDGYEAGRQQALSLLAECGVSQEAARAGMASLLALPDSMRGAMLLCAETGRRLDGQGMRGVRVSRMDSADPVGYHGFLTDLGLAGEHAREAMVLAAKVAAAPGVLAELCWSDDPDYTAGYVAFRQGYMRISQLKPTGSPQGGRVFFLQPGTPLAELEEYLTSCPVLVRHSE